MRTADRALQIDAHESLLGSTGEQIHQHWREDQRGEIDLAFRRTTGLGIDEGEILRIEDTFGDVEIAFQCIVDTGEVPQHTVDRVTDALYRLDLRAQNAQQGRAQLLLDLADDHHRSIEIALAGQRAHQLGLTIAAAKHIELERQRTFDLAASNAAPQYLAKLNLVDQHLGVDFRRPITIDRGAGQIEATAINLAVQGLHRHQTVLDGDLSDQIIDALVRHDQRIGLEVDIGILLFQSLEIQRLG